MDKGVGILLVFIFCIIGYLILGGTVVFSVVKGGKYWKAERKCLESADNKFEELDCQSTRLDGDIRVIGVGVVAIGICGGLIIICRVLLFWIEHG